MSYEKLREECNRRLPERAPKEVEMHDCPDCTGDEWDDATDYDYCKPCSTCGREDGIAIKKVPPGEVSIADVLRVLEYERFLIDAGGRLCELTPEPRLICTFNLAAPLSDPSNAAACEAVLSIITNV